ncbi:hypothetical protein [Thalassolituus marinus]|uniref:hypothetical protein n=1 Tax=Thalassolituus marinus TaxID=671053 RepID=UPI001CE38F94|nr:hypothetical protein [Thalassolituus marinus]
MSAEPRQTRFEDLKLLPGQPLQLDFEGYSSDRDRSLLVGYRAGQGIIVTTPIVNGSPLGAEAGYTAGGTFVRDSGKFCLCIPHGSNPYIPRALSASASGYA